MHPSVLILGGPTASGKSALALTLAEHYNGVIINADSKQVYAGVPLITAQPTAVEQQQVPHRLYGILSPAVSCSAGMWVTMAAEAIKETWAAGKWPILVGGTGLYIRALMHGISPIPDIPFPVRQEAMAYLASVGTQTLYEELCHIDPDIQGRIDPHNGHRLVRAYEVWKHTGESIVAWHKKGHIISLPEVSYHSFFLAMPRPWLYERCHTRFMQMIEEGVLDEVRYLKAMGLPSYLPVMRSHGVPELLAYLEGQCTLEEAITQAVRNTRHYVKRQYTWFSHQWPEAMAGTPEIITKAVALLALSR